MSYVIQNYYIPTKSISMTPRFKNYLFLINLPNLLCFLKMQTLINTQKINENLLLFSWLPFIKYFFNFNMKNILILIDQKIWSNYSNNLNKSFLFWKYNFMIWHFKRHIFKFYTFLFASNFNFNIYSLSIKTNPQFLTKKFYKNVFFFKLFYVMFIWPQTASNFKFYLNFLLTFNSFHLLKFFSGPFFKIYNF